MDQGHGFRLLIRKGVVVREDHIHLEIFSALQCFFRGHSVVDRDQKSDPLCMELFHHPWVQPIPVIHSAWNRRLGSGTKTAEGSQEQGGAGHAVGVVITANGQSLPRLARRLKACKRRGELGEVVVGSRRVLIAQESLHVLCC